MNDPLTLLAGDKVIAPPNQRVASVVWRRLFDAVACPEDEGGFSVFAVHYPGVLSQAENIADAKSNIAEAFLLMREVMGEGMTYSESPWMPMSKDCLEFQVKVTV
jgi:predicted RNase H-like HicB family nuclease